MGITIIIIHFFKSINWVEKCRGGVEFTDGQVLTHTFGPGSLRPLSILNTNGCSNKNKNFNLILNLLFCICLALPLWSKDDESFG